MANVFYVDIRQMKLKLMKRRMKMNKLLLKLIKVANLLDDANYQKEAEIVTRIAESFSKMKK